MSTLNTAQPTPRYTESLSMIRQWFITLLMVGACSAMANGASTNKEAPPDNALTTIGSLDVPRYMGTWFEVAKYPNWFQKKCVGGARASYSLMGDGRVQVINRCRLAGGDFSEATGVARQIGPSTSPKLQVRFAPAWLSFLPFVWGNYWVIDLDEDYQLAAISEPGRQYLWILSRTPKVDAARYQQLLGRLRQKGFDLERLEASPPEE